jgi:hypothetical protein
MTVSGTSVHSATWRYMTALYDPVSPVSRL